MRAVLASALVLSASAVHVHTTKKVHKAGKPETAAPRCDGSPNTLPLYDEEPTFVTKAANGLKFTMAPAGYANPLTVLHVYGSQYDMGFAYGTLMKEEITWLVPQVYDYLDFSINSSLPSWIPVATRDKILQYGVPAALNLTYEATRPYTPDWHYDTLRGMSDATGIDYYRLAGLSMVPELIKASCSIMGAWGGATANGAKGLIQLRALDWSTDGPFQQYPVLMTWHPTNGHNFTALTWAGFLGAITGMSSTGMGISEKVWLQYQGVENIYGYVWNFLLQDILQFDWDSDLALSRIASANRTCSIWIGLGDAANNQFRVVGYSNQEVNIWNDKNFPAYPNHDLFEGLVFIDKHVQWSSNPCMNDLMHANYGKIDALTTSSQITAYAETGNMHIAVMDFAASVMLLSNAAPTATFGVEGTPAYVRQFFKVDMAKQWTLDLAAY